MIDIDLDYDSKDDEDYVSEPENEDEDCDNEKIIPFEEPEDVSTLDNALSEMNINDTQDSG